jgi:hypothetical protein
MQVMLGNEAGGGLADIIQGSITAKVLLTTGEGRHCWYCHKRVQHKLKAMAIFAY